MIPNKNTANRYYFATVKLFQSLQFNKLEEIPEGFIEQELSRLKTKNDFSAAKNGLKHLYAFDGSLPLPTDTFLHDEASKKRNRSKRPPKTLYLDTIKRKINACPNQKLKLAFRLMLVSGLRVSEAAQLEKEDITLQGDRLIVNVKHGKGGSNGRVVCERDPYLEKNIPLYLSTIQDEERPFYSASTMKEKAAELGLECHDLRRIAAIMHRKRMMQEEQQPVQKANEDTKNFLRHVRFSTTKRYLFNRKLSVKNR